MYNILYKVFGHIVPDIDNVHGLLLLCVEKQTII